MISLAISERDRRTLRLGVMTVACLVGAARGVPAWRGWERARVEEAAGLAKQLATAEAARGMLPRLRDSLRARAARVVALDSLLLTGASRAEAGAALASYLSDLADSAPLKVATVQIRPDTGAVRSLAIVAVRLNGMTDVTGLAALLRSIEGSETPLAVRELAVSQPDLASPDSRPETLRVDLLVEGLARITSLSRR